MSEYVTEERALHPGKKIIGILANTNNDDIRVWKSYVDDTHLLLDETVLDTMEHYVNQFAVMIQNDREAVLKNTLALNELLHKKDIDEAKRSQFVGTTLLYIKKMVKQTGLVTVDEEMKNRLKMVWDMMDEKSIRAAIGSTLDELLDGSENKQKKIELLQQNVLNDQKVKKLKKNDWIEILNTLLFDIYRYINADSSEGQDILNIFFIAFNKYTGKADKNQAFTPDHIVHFMCRVIGINRYSKVLDPCCGSGAFLVRAMVEAMNDCSTDQERENVKKKQIFGIEYEETAFGLSTTNMLIHGDGNSNIVQGSCFDKSEFIEDAQIDKVLMNPPYNAQKKHCKPEYVATWKNNTKEDPSKGLHYVYEIASKVKTGKLAVLLPMACAIGSSSDIQKFKEKMLNEHTLDAVFSLPNEIFYPGASAVPCCMVFTLGTRHCNSPIKGTFFGYFKDDGFTKKKNLGRVEKLNEHGVGIRNEIENERLNLYHNRVSKPGISVVTEVTANDERLAEAYMRTDYLKLMEKDFEKTRNEYLSYLVRIGKWNDFYSFVNSIDKSGRNELKIDEWKEFRVGDLFIKRTLKYYSAMPEGDGNYEFISSSSMNNGISGMVDGDSVSGNCITVSTNGSCFDCFYHHDDIVISSDVDVLYNPYLNQYNAIFICSILGLEKVKYSYGRKPKKNKVFDTIIKLPTTLFGEPDREYMENYIKNLPYGDRI